MSDGIDVDRIKQRASEIIAGLSDQQRAEFFQRALASDHSSRRTDPGFMQTTLQVAANWLATYEIDGNLEPTPENGLVPGLLDAIERMNRGGRRPSRKAKTAAPAIDPAVGMDDNRTLAYALRVMTSLTDQEMDDLLLHMGFPTDMVEARPHSMPDKSHDEQAAIIEQRQSRDWLGALDNLTAAFMQIPKDRREDALLKGMAMLTQQQTQQQDINLNSEMHQSLFRLAQQFARDALWVGLDNEQLEQRYPRGRYSEALKTTWDKQKDQPRSRGEPGGPGVH